ncbi:hypothetical protein A0H81_07145 [Grifola frondosa]|uniref:Uncharacterized protein n=1 Tax=Grifola frondosa TaxID=5627 RepID=A0A1C7M840_GRIFR|nr:hypothetical protein A0H81_07145 [Grifola frondosa]
MMLSIVAPVGPGSILIQDNAQYPVVQVGLLCSVDTRLEVWRSEASGLSATTLSGYGLPYQRGEKPVAPLSVFSTNHSALCNIPSHRFGAKMNELYLSWLTAAIGLGIVVSLRRPLLCPTTLIQCTGNPVVNAGNPFLASVGDIDCDAFSCARNTQSSAAFFLHWERQWCRFLRQLPRIDCPLECRSSDLLAVLTRGGRMKDAVGKYRNPG